MDRTVLPDASGYKKEKIWVWGKYLPINIYFYHFPRSKDSGPTSRMSITTASNNELAF